MWTPLTILLAACSGPAEPPLVVPPDATAITLIYSARGDGEIEPCG